MKTDIEIAQETKMLPIKDVAAQYGISEDDLELYGKYKAKISNELWNEVRERPDGKLVLVTAINPTPAGKDHHQHRTGPGPHKSGKEDHASLKRAVPGTVLRDQGRSCRRRIRPGGAHGGSEPAFYR